MQEITTAQLLICLTSLRRELLCLHLAPPLRNAFDSFIDTPPNAPQLNTRRLHTPRLCRSPCGKALPFRSAPKNLGGYAAEIRDERSAIFWSLTISARESIS
jgi:hypothetical protein